MHSGGLWSSLERIMLLVYLVRFADTDTQHNAIVSDSENKGLFVAVTVNICHTVPPKIRKTKFPPKNFQGRWL